MRFATFNVLADSYTGYGDYRHAEPELLEPGARFEGIVRCIGNLGADVVCLQEAEAPLLEAFSKTDEWQTLWSPKGRNKPDGCLMLVKHGVEIDRHVSFPYGDESGHICQLARIGKLVVANTHIKWAPSDEPEHAGLTQTSELLAALGSRQAAVVLGDFNDRPGGPVRRLVERAGFSDVNGDTPTAVVNGEPVALDLLAVRGVSAAKQIYFSYDIGSIPNRECPSDHIPIVADIDV